MKKINTEKAPAAVGAYSQAVVSGSFVFTSGLLGITANGELATGIARQTATALKNLSKILDAAGSSIENVVKTTCYLADINDFDVFNEIYANFFEHRPARTLIQAAALPKGALVEIEAVAELEKVVVSFNYDND